ncbi:MAG: hypothetical protein M3Q65_12525 [Chloroflexota bacterium]|nr:hypothetical protein [Chloroflexota bacterium]
MTRQDADRDNIIKALEAAVDSLREQSGRERAALEAEAAMLRDALGRERERADRLETDRSAARALVDRRGQEVIELRERAGRAEAEREAAKVAAAAAEGEAKGLREALTEARRPFWRRWLGVAALCAASGLWPAVASAQEDPGSATWVMPGCRAAIARADTGADTGEMYRRGVCDGIVSGISFMDADTCKPKGVTLGQMIRVVVRYIDARPARQHESFNGLALEALRAAWPCR